MEKVAALISALLALSAAPPYIIDTLNRKTKPQRATWLIFSVLSTIAFVSQLKLGASWSLVFLGLDALASMVVLGLSIPLGVGGHTQLDKVVLAIAGIGTVISVVTDRPIIALLGVIAADICGFVPTIKKAYLDPGSETTISWLLFGGAGLFGALAVGSLEAKLLIYPLYIALVSFSIPLVQLISPKGNKARAKT
ncbi:MAG TPA: hypothetical protein VMT23_00470 [Candidatus Binatia bacterium]|nr:hypothetical protein [Candidatus Binatia bacterium]